MIEQHSDPGTTGHRNGQARIGDVHRRFRRFCRSGASAGTVSSPHRRDPRRLRSGRYRRRPLQDRFHPNGHGVNGRIAGYGAPRRRRPSLRTSGHVRRPIRVGGVSV